MERVIANEFACWVHVREEGQRLVLTRAADATKVSCPVALALDVIKQQAPEAFYAWAGDNLDDRYDAGYQAGYADGHSDGASGCVTEDGDLL